MIKLVILLAASVAANAAQATGCQECKAQRREQALEYLQKYDDPAQREELRRQAIERARHSQREFARQRNLDAEQFGKLAEAVANYDLATNVQHERCYADPACRMATGFDGMWDRHQQELTSILGDDGLREMHAWTRRKLDLRFLEAFSARLQHFPLSAGQATTLIAALQEVRDSAAREFKASQQPYSVYGDCHTLMVMYALAPTIDERVTSARFYVQRVRGRAETLLYGEQLSVFDQMQEELLTDMQDFLRKWDAGERGYN